MKKRILVILLSIALVVSGLFVGFSGLIEKRVEAAEGGSLEDNGINIKGTYDHVNSLYRLEAYAEGSAQVISKTVRVPVDIVFVLDTSGSMEEGYIPVKTFSNTTEFKSYFAKETATSDYGYLVKDSGSSNSYTRIRVNNGTLQYRSNSSWYTFSGSTFEKNYNGSISLYEYRIQALKNGALDALDTMYNDAIANKVVHNISIVTFADGSSIKANSLSVVDNYNTLKGIIKDLSADGATYADDAMEDALKIIEAAYKNTGRESSKTVLFFTDGYPTHSSGLSCNVAIEAMTAAKKIKALGAKIYSISCMEDVNPSDALSTSYKDESETTNKAIMKAFMHSVSSNFPNASATFTEEGFWIWTTGTMTFTYGEGSTSNGYFKTVSSAIDFKTTFTEVVQETLDASVKTELSVESFVHTVLFAKYFTLPDNAKVEDIKVYNQTYDGKTQKFSGIDVPMTDAIVSIDTDKESVTVSNFDFAGNWCGPNAQNGKMLVIVIPLQRTAECPEGDEVPVVDWENSGLFDESGEQVGKVEEVKVPVYKITIDEDGGDSMEDIYYVERDNVTLPAGPTKTGYNFTKWKVTVVGPNGTEGATWTLNAEMDAGAIVNIAKGDITIKALYTPIMYTIKFVNDDNSVLQTGSVAYDTMPSYTAATPTKTATAQYTYTFKGWDKTIAKVTGDATYKATYDSTTNKYTVTWTNYDDSVIETDLEVPYGTTPTFNSSTPTKTGTAQYSYTFLAWSPVVSSVTGDVTYKATFTETTNKYTITWKNYDESVIETDLEVLYGATPTFNSNTPVKPDDDVYTYTFSTWSPVVSSVTGDQTYVAQFTSTEKSVTINYVAKANGSVNVSTETILVSTGTASGSTATADRFYKFVGWYDNEACTGTAVSTSATFVPAKASNLNVAKTYYALFEIDVCDVTITKTVIGQETIEQTFVFELINKNDASFKMTVVIHGEDFEDGVASVTIKNLPYGEYTVSEDVDWAWQYTTESSSEDVDTTEEAEVEFVNTFNGDIYWLNEVALPVKNVRKKAED